MVCSVSTEESDVKPLVLRVEAVKWAIDYLTAQPVHTFFLAYLHLRARAAETGSPDAITPNWGELGQYLLMPGGPAGKPYYRPFLGQNKTGKPWLNSNLAGSYAPSSIRPGPITQVVKIEHGTYSLQPNHTEAALTNLLYDHPLSILALSVFLMRNKAFKGTLLNGPEYSPEVYATLPTLVFADAFHIHKGSEGDARLFNWDLESPVRPLYEWLGHPEVKVPLDLELDTP